MARHMPHPDHNPPRHGAGVAREAAAGTAAHRHGRSHQGGAALLIMMLILILGAAALVTRGNLQGRLTSPPERATTAGLATAREALLAHALTWDAAHPGEYGALPCPDLDASGTWAEGEAHEGACGPAYHSRIGRLPWRTLGLAPARSAGIDCLWYAVSGTWKAAGSASPQMRNSDTSGQFRIRGADGTTLLTGTDAASRAVAVIIAPGPALPGQTRTAAASGVEQCGGNYLASQWLDADHGFDNAALAGTAHAIDDFLAGDPSVGANNDRLLWITRADIETRLHARADFRAQMTELGEALARCIADVAQRNPGGASDHRLPWPAPLDLADYRLDAQYDDTPLGALSGRLPDTVNDSAALTGSPVARALTDCDPLAVPAWTPTMQTLWQHWKDHFFYAVALDLRPDATPGAACTTCLRVNGAGAWAAVVIYAGPRLDTLGQVRDEPPADADTRQFVAHYLEGRNATNHPNSGGNGDYQSAAATTTFNDQLWCIAGDLSVTSC